MVGRAGGVPEVGGGGAHGDGAGLVGRDEEGGRWLARRGGQHEGQLNGTVDERAFADGRVVGDGRVRPRLVMPVLDALAAHRDVQTMRLQTMAMMANRYISHSPMMVRGRGGGSGSMK